VRGRVAAFREAESLKEARDRAVDRERQVRDSVRAQVALVISRVVVLALAN
jgi:hypothetical protein